MPQRTARDEVFARLEDLPPDAWRDVLAEWDRARRHRGGEIRVTIRVLGDGRETVVLARAYERRAGGGA